MIEILLSDAGTHMTDWQFILGRIVDRYNFRDSIEKKCMLLSSSSFQIFTQGKDLPEYNLYVFFAPNSLQQKKKKKILKEIGR